MNILLIYAEFFKVGIFAVGGGLATLPFLFQMADGRFTFIRQAGWLNREMLGNFLAIAQCSPGAIGVNMAAQAGFRYSGIAGGVLAALGLISPAIIIIALIARALKSFKENKTVASVFTGLRPAATGILCAAGFGVWKLALYNSEGAVFYEIIRWRECIVLAAIFLLVYKFKSHPTLYIALGAIAGIALGLGG
ncbi:MAG: chromate transporter [Treponema sp.]|jgi:chromate transporter|nr:chromate transporter [Treponema sp.]